MDKKRVMLVIPELGVGGAQRSFAKLSVELARKFDVFLVVFNNTLKCVYPVGGEIFSLDVYPGTSLLSKFRAFRQRINKLSELKARLRIDVSISFLEGADYINVLSKKDDRVILSIRGSKLHDENMLRYYYGLRSGILIPWLYKKADAIIAVSHGIANELVTRYKIPARKVVTIGNFYDSAAILKLAAEPKEAGIARWYDRHVLITTGRISVEKGLPGLVSAFSALRRKRGDIRLVIVGDGPDKENVLRSCMQHNLIVADEGENTSDTPDVAFLGERDNVFKYLNGSAIYLMNSSSEGFPNGLVEAMICGVPVMTANCPYGPAEILSPGSPVSLAIGDPIFADHGILMPAASGKIAIDKWADTMNLLIDDADTRHRLACSARERVHDFDRDTVMDQWCKVILQMS